MKVYRVEHGETGIGIFRSDSHVIHAKDIFTRLGSAPSPHDDTILIQKINGVKLSMGLGHTLHHPLHQGNTRQVCGFTEYQLKYWSRHSLKKIEAMLKGTLFVLRVFQPSDFTLFKTQVIFEKPV